MTKRESLYLDLVRALAAIAVVLDHAPYSFDVTVPRWGHQAVVVFFVLSGYVISHTADVKENTARVFLIARFARLWSVLVPAIALTIVCDVLGRSLGIHPESYQGVPSDYPVIRTVAILAFLSETWVSIQPFSNGVVWSLCCEFWYYMMFAAWTFIPRRQWRIAALACLTALAGHKALLLLPIWLSGVALQRWAALRRLGPTIEQALWVGGLLGAALILATRLYDPAIALMQASVTPWVFTQLAEVRVFWLDWLLGLLIAAHLLGARTAVARLPLERIATPVRWCAGISFAAYLFHMPLYHFWGAWLPRSAGWLAIGLTFGAIAVLAPPAERSKRWWRRKLNQLVDAGLRLDGGWGGRIGKASRRVLP